MRLGSFPSVLGPQKIALPPREENECLLGDAVRSEEMESRILAIVKAFSIISPSKGYDVVSHTVANYFALLTV